MWLLEIFNLFKYMTQVTFLLGSGALVQAASLIYLYMHIFQEMFKNTIETSKQGFQGVMWSPLPLPTFLSYGVTQNSLDSAEPFKP